MTQGDSAGHILRAATETNSPEVEAFALRHMAAVARRRNAYGLMAGVVRACQEMRLDLNSVLSTAVEDVEEDLDASTHPFETLRFVSEAKGYCHLRTITPDGRNAFFNNAAFEHDILSLEVCNRTYARNEVEVLSLFIHPSDLAATHRFLAGVWRTAAVNSGRLALVESPDRVRIYHRRLQAHAECTMRIAMHIQLDVGCVSAAVEFTMCDGVGRLEQLGGAREGAAVGGGEALEEALSVAPCDDLAPVDLGDGSCTAEAELLGLCDETLDALLDSIRS